jgi:hypothetical protein
MIFFLSCDVSAQSATDSVAQVDTVNKKDSLPPGLNATDTTIVSDSLVKRPLLMDTLWSPGAPFPFPVQILQHHPFFNYAAKPVRYRSDIRRFEGKELLFYAIVGLLLLFALLKAAFPKYFNDLFRVFFRTTLKQRQIKEQLIQTPLPSLLLNLFFVASAGLYANFILQYYGVTLVDNFWLMYFYCCIGLAIIYTVKYIGLKIFGWLFNMRTAADAYIFVVFIINKVIGVTVLPFLVLLAFDNGTMHDVSMILSWVCIGGLFLYRFILGYSAIHKEVRFNLFHFFLYLCAFEIAPLLLIYKLLLFFF